MKNKPLTPVIAGLIIAAILVVCSLLINVLGQTGNSGLGALQYLIIIIALVVLVQQHGKAYGYTKSFGELFSFGFKTTTVFTLIFIVFLVIFLSLTPDIKEKSLEMARKKLEQQGRSDAEITKAIDISSKYFWTFLIGTTLFFFVLIGAIGSLIGAAVTKKQPRNPLSELDQLDQSR